MISFAEEIKRATEGKMQAAFCLVVETKGSTPRPIGAKMIVYEDGSIYNTIGGGSLEKQVIKDALNQMQKNEPALYKHDLLHQHNMCCGGTVTIYIEPIMKRKKLYVFGAGHTGVALANFALPMEFEIFVIDDRKEYLDAITNSEINKLHASYNEVLPSLPFDENTFVVILTYEHSIDRDILSYCINQPHAYLGMIGSNRKVKLTRKMFLEAGIATVEQLDMVDMPMGVPIDADGPSEIAVSILAKLISVKNECK